MRIGFQECLFIKKAQMPRGSHPVCGGGLARDPAWVATRRLIAGKPAPTTLSDSISRSKRHARHSGESRNPDDARAERMDPGFRRDDDG